jgi:hypothetical protein
MEIPARALIVFRLDAAEFRASGGFEYPRRDLESTEQRPHPRVTMIAERAQVSRHAALSRRERVFYEMPRRRRAAAGREGAGEGGSSWRGGIHAIHSPQIAARRKAELFSHELFCPLS